MKDVWNAMADPTRRQILTMLQNGDMTAGEISEKFDISAATISHQDTPRSRTCNIGKGKADYNIQAQHNSISGLPERHCRRIRHERRKS